MSTNRTTNQTSNGSTDRASGQAEGRSENVRRDCGQSGDRDPLWICDDHENAYLRDSTHSVDGGTDAGDPLDNAEPAEQATSTISMGAAWPLRAAENAFQLLIAGPRPLAVDGEQLGCGLPDRLIDVGELRRLLLRSSTTQEARDAVWRYVIECARAQEAWMVAAAGLACPGLIRLSRRLSEGIPDADDLQSEVLTAFIAAVHTINLGWDHLALNLCRIACKNAMRQHFAGTRSTPIPPETAASIAPCPPWGHPDLLLADAVRQRIITQLDAYLIGETRLGDDALGDLAAQLGMSYWQAAKRRRRAELKLVAAITDGRLHTRLPG